MLKRILLSLTLVLLTSVFVGCTDTRQEAPKVHTRYTTQGRYYTDGTLITNDGNEWGYDTDTISDKIPYNSMPVYVGFDDNGTPDDITDNIILGLVYDRNTAIYDKLEMELSKEFTVFRDGNNLKIGERNYD